VSGIYDYEERLQRSRRIIKGLRNGELALSFLDHLLTLGLSLARVSAYAAHLTAILRVADFDLRKASRKDVEKVVAWINSQPYSDATKRDKKITLKKLVQYAKYGSCDSNTPYPKEVAWIKTGERAKNSRISPEKLLSKEEFEAIVKATDNPRDRALVYTLFEGALRPGELLTMTVGSVEFRDTYCLITVNGKTGIKRIPLVASFKPLLKWLEEHPNRDDPNAPLWCSLSTNYKGRRLSYAHFRLIIKNLVKKAGIKKDVWPYLFRHTTLTNLAKVFTEAKLEQYAGWVHGSKMTSRYVHFPARDLEDAVLELHGLERTDKIGNVSQLISCPRCGQENPLGTVYCDFCGFILDKKMVQKIEEKEQEKDRQMEQKLLRMQNEIAQLKSLISKMIQQATSPRSSPAFQVTSAPAQANSLEQPQEHPSSMPQPSPPIKKPQRS